MNNRDKTVKLIRCQRITIGVLLLTSGFALFVMHGYAKDWQEMAEDAWVREGDCRNSLFEMEQKLKHDQQIIQEQDALLRRYEQPAGKPDPVTVKGVPVEIMNAVVSQGPRLPGLRLRHNVIVEFDVNRDADVRVNVLTKEGRLVVPLVKRNRHTMRALPGLVYRLAWDGIDSDNRDMPAGSYIAEIKAMAYGRTHTVRKPIMLPWLQ
ncbi:MAG: hypothetical protein V4671_26590 [Armatimonadota bacterium]